MSDCNCYCEAMMKLKLGIENLLDILQWKMLTNTLDHVLGI